MRVRISLLLPAIAGCLLWASPARATDYAYGYTSTYVDGNVVRGYHRTEVDYNTDVYYTPYVCASLYKDGTEVVRACGGGFASATRNTQTPYVSGLTYSALSDHYVNIEYEEEDPYNPGYYYYPDYLGYSFSGGGSQPIDWYYVASGIYNSRPDQSIRLGDTNATMLPPVTFLNASILYGSPAPFENVGGVVQSANLTATASQCNPSSSFVLHVTYALPEQTTEVYEVTAQGLGNTSVRNWNVSQVSNSNSFSHTPPTGSILITANNKNGGQTSGPPYNAIRITVKGKYNSGQPFSTPANVRIECP